MRIGIMTGGGDAPGLNGIIEAASRTLLREGHEVHGILDGFDGIFSERSRPIAWKEIVGIHAHAGTFLGTSNKTQTEGRGAEFREKFDRMGLDGLIAAGGDGTFFAFNQLAPDLPLIGVPKTIDNDLQGTDVTFGYDTACSVVADAVEALRSTANAHHRLMVVEAMGRTAGWIALGGGLAGAADAILIAERPYSREALLTFLRAEHAKGAPGMVIVVSEGVMAAGENAEVIEEKHGVHGVRFGGVGERLAHWIQSETPWESRHVVLGHLQRSRAPTTTDRFLTSAMGIRAAQLAVEKNWNRAVVYRGGKVIDAPLSDIQGAPRTVDPEHRWVKNCQNLGIFI